MRQGVIQSTAVGVEFLRQPVDCVNTRAIRRGINSFDQRPSRACAARCRINI